MIFDFCNHMGLQAILDSIKANAATQNLLMLGSARMVAHKKPKFIEKD